VVAIVKSGQQLFNAYEAALKSQNEDAADADAPDIAMVALFNMKKFVMSAWATQNYIIVL
jgi:hypothetical protein